MQNLIPSILSIVSALEGDPVLQKTVATLLQPVVSRIADHLLARPAMDQTPLLDVAPALGVLRVYAAQTTRAVTRPPVFAPVGAPVAAALPVASAPVPAPAGVQ